MAKPTGFTKAAAERIARAVLRVEKFGRGSPPSAASSYRANESSEYQYFRLDEEMQPCGVTTASRVFAVCCGGNDLRMDLIDPPEEFQLTAALYDHLGSGRLFNISEGKRRNAKIAVGTYALARWVSFANANAQEDCGANGVWEIVGFLPCAAAACGMQSSASSASSESSASSDKKSSDSASSKESSQGSSWRSTGSGDCTDCGYGGICVVTDVKCEGGELTVEKAMVDAPECCGGGCADGSGEDGGGDAILPL